MDKPKKKEFGKEFNEDSNCDYNYVIGYNQCWDNREKWLKEKQMSVEEINEIVNGVIKQWGKDGRIAMKNQEARLGWAMVPTDRTDLAKEIHKELEKRRK